MTSLNPFNYLELRIGQEQLLRLRPHSQLYHSLRRHQHIPSIMSNSAPSSSHSDEQPSPPQELSASGLTIPSDSEAFSSLSPPSTSPPQSSSNNNNDNNGSHEQKVVIYGRPTFWSLLRGAAINLLLPFVNGMMLGLGELLAHEIAFRWGWGTTQVCRAYDWGAGIGKTYHYAIMPPCRPVH